MRTYKDEDRQVKKEKEKYVDTRVVTPQGRLSFPYLHTPDVGRSEYSDGRIKTDLIISKADFKEQGTALVNMVVDVARDFFGDEGLTLNDFAHPFKDTDKLPKDRRQKLPESVRDGHIIIRAKFWGKDEDDRPEIIGPDKSVWGEKQVKKIEGGHWARLIVRPFGYPQQGGGVTLALSLVQYIKPDEVFGGRTSSIDMIDEMEVTPEDLGKFMEPEAEVEAKADDPLGGLV